MWQIDLFQFLAAVGLDLLLGDPRGWPHLTRLAGHIAAALEKFWSSAMGRNVPAGVCFWLSVCGGMLAAYAVVRQILEAISPTIAWTFDILVIYQTVAARDLDGHARAVAVPLVLGDLEESRRRVGFLVGRDTVDLDVQGVSRATVEAVAESATDGFVAPLFWAVVGGVPGALLYRCANTLDSMVGHRNERYELFGKFSALTDDALTFIPARLCALLSLLPRGFRYAIAVMEDAAKHSSPNAGWGEAAAAWALNLRLGGLNFYDGIPAQGPIFNKNGQPPEPRDILRVLRWFWGVAFLCVILFGLYVAKRDQSERTSNRFQAPMISESNLRAPVLKQEYVLQPSPAPVKLQGQIIYGTKSTP